MQMNKTCLCSIFDTKYLALEMKKYLFTRQNRSDISNYVDNLTTATSLSSLYDLLTSKFYDNLIFFKPIIEMNSTDRYKNEVWVNYLFNSFILLTIFFRNMKLVMMRICPVLYFSS
jgi:hypothetical protein